MFANVAMGMDIDVFEEILAKMKKNKGVELDTQLDAGDLEKLVGLYKQAYKKHKKEEFPPGPQKSSSRLPLTRSSDPGTTLRP